MSVEKSTTSNGDSGEQQHQGYQGHVGPNVIVSLVWPQSLAWPQQALRQARQEHQKISEKQNLAEHGRGASRILGFFKDFKKMSNSLKDRLWNPGRSPNCNQKVMYR